MKPNLNLDSKLTEQERAALEAPYNLADGHARNYLPEFWRAFSAVTPERLAEKTQLAEEAAFRRAFGAALGQSISDGDVESLLLPSASLALEIVAHVIAARGLTLAAPEPCFDNVIDIFRHHAVPVIAYRVDTQPLEHALAAIECANVDAVLVVAPGNPTGCHATMADVSIIIDASRKRRKVLILDASFRAFSAELSTVDLYRSLIASGVEFVVVEDTGKFLASHDLKTSILACSQRLFHEALGIYDDILIAQSPLTLAILTTTLEYLGPAGIARARDLVKENRLALRAALPSWMQPYESSRCSVEWVRVAQPRSGVETRRRIAQQGVAVLPGGPFYWFSPGADGSAYLRFALLRDSDYFEAAVNRCLVSLFGEER
jgi:aspartate/methionine/tyrosine aminotransferase